MNKSKILFLVLSGAAFIMLGTILYQSGQPLPVEAPEALPQAMSPPNAEESADPEAVTPAPLTVRESVLQLTGQIGDGTPQSRRAALKALPNDLNEKELASIYTAILQHPQPEDFARRAWHAFFNDTLNALVLHQKEPVVELPSRLLAIVQDAERHRVIRDYALQHLLAFAEYRSAPSERVEQLEAAWQGIAATHDSFHGTYLLALSYQAGTPGWPTPENIAAKAWKVASADDAHVLSRISALQVCGKLGYADALPLALEIAADRQAHMTLRTSAIATIGDLGTAAERSKLTTLAERSPPRLQVAIDAALIRIGQKKGQV